MFGISYKSIKLLYTFIEENRCEYKKLIHKLSEEHADDMRMLDARITKEHQDIIKILMKLQESITTLEKTK